MFVIIVVLIIIICFSFRGGKEYLSKEDFLNSLPAGCECSLDNYCAVDIKPKKNQCSTWYYDGKMYFGRKPETFEGKLEADGDFYFDKFNPKLEVREHEGFNVVRDDLLEGGSKIRATLPFIKKYLAGAKEIVYAGPNNGLAQLALAKAGKELGIKFKMFTYYGNNDIIKRAKEYGAQYVFAKKPLADMQKDAESYCKQSGASMLPFGFGHENFQKMMIYALEKVRIKIPKSAYIWLVCGSATLVNVLYYIFPDNFFCVLQVGKKIWADQLDLSRTKLFKSNLKFIEDAKILPPYPCIASYDAKIWEFVKKYGRKGDYIWNVGV